MNLAKAMLLTLRDLLKIPVVIYQSVALRWILFTVIVIGLPIIVSIFFGYHNWGAATVISGLLLAGLALGALIRYGEFKTSGFGDSEWTGKWDFDRRNR